MTCLLYLKRLVAGAGFEPTTLGYEPNEITERTVTAIFYRSMMFICDDWWCSLGASVGHSNAEEYQKLNFP
jgi:hypothetical protein